MRVLHGGRRTHTRHFGRTDTAAAPTLRPHRHCGRTDTRHCDRTDTAAVAVAGPAQGCGPGGRRREGAPAWTGTRPGASGPARAPAAPPPPRASPAAPTARPRRPCHPHPPTHTRRASQAVPSHSRSAERLRCLSTLRHQGQASKVSSNATRVGLYRDPSLSDPGRRGVRGRRSPLIPTRTCTDPHASTHSQSRICVSTHPRIHSTPPPAHLVGHGPALACPHTHTCTRTHARAHAHAHAHAHARARAHTHTHTRGS
jgi:hypothetical protein